MIKKLITQGASFTRLWNLFFKVSVQTIPLIVFLIMFSGIVSLQLSAGEVPFSNRIQVTEGFTRAMEVLCVDVDGDADLDIVGSAYTGNEIAWWENDNGSGTFTTKHPVALNVQGASSISSADIDRDGDIDLVGTAYLDDQICWWENTDGSGVVWKEHSASDMAGGPWSVYPADVDGDGDIDILGSLVSDDDVIWLENVDGIGGSWDPHTVSDSFLGACDVCAADVDHDGDIDVIGAAEWAQDIVWWENTDGSATTWDEHVVETDFSMGISISFADVDGDGDIDVLGAAASADEIAWWENTDRIGNSWDKHTVESFFDGAWNVHAVDLDGDGDCDILSAAHDGDTLTWWDNIDAREDSWTSYTIDGTALGASCVYPGDIDGDGDLDIISALDDEHKITWYKNLTIHRNAVFSRESAINTTFAKPESLSVADIDNDGKPDVLGVSSDEAGIAWWHTTDDHGTSWTTQIISSSFQGACSAAPVDIDRDGDIDVVGASPVLDTVAWWENRDDNGTSWTQHILTDDLDARGVFVVDVNGNRKMDIVCAGGDDDMVVWWENNDDTGTSWTEHIVATGFSIAECVYSTDMDRDGDVDILAAASQDNEVVWWENIDWLGTSWMSHTVDNTFEGACSLRAVDIDKDGNTDILGAASTGNEIAWWRNEDGEGTSWEKDTVANDVQGACSIDPVDVDLDGDIDLVGAVSGNNAIIWWERVDDGATSWSAHSITDSCYGAAAVCSGDIDCDGDPDIIAAAREGNSVYWWKNDGGQFSLSTVSTAPSSLNEGLTDDVLKIVATHNGRSGDSDVELAAFELRIEDTQGNPLTTIETTALIADVSIYLDDGSGAFEGDIDSLIDTVSTDSITVPGARRLLFDHGDPYVRIPDSEPRTYFVVVALTSDASNQSPDTFRLTHLTESSSAADDSVYAIPLIMEYAPNTSSIPVVADIPPSVSSVVSLNTSPTNVPAIDFQVVFREEVTGVDTTDFEVVESGVTSTSVITVSNVGTTYTVKVNTGNGDGSIRLNVLDDDSIVDINDTSLGGEGIGNGEYSGGDVVVIDKTPPDTRATSPNGELVQEDPVILIYFTVTETGSGIDGVSLFYRKDESGSFQKHGDTYTVSPISFDSSFTGGDGKYEFYTIGIDAVGNLEDPPSTPDIIIDFNDITNVKNWFEF